MKRLIRSKGREFNLDLKKLPRHVAIIMDGNGRWASQRGLPRIAGHRAAIESVRDVVKACGELGLEVLSLYAFSVENWMRPASEVKALMGMLRELIIKEINELKVNNVKLMAMGRISDLPEAVREELENGIEVTASNTGLILNLALSYGGRSEIVDAVKKLASDLLKGFISPDEINESKFSEYLYTSHLPDPDLLIRTSGEMRVSNFLLWQIAYTEIWITDILWPDFRREHLFEAIRDYQRRERRFGKVLL